VYLVALAALLGLSIAVRFGQATRTAMRGAAAGGLLVLGVIAAFSIGLPLIVGGILAGIAAARSARPPGRFAATLLGFAAAFVAVAVLIAGFEVTERAIVCPVSGTASGGGAGFVTGPYHYQCVNGRLNFQSGSCNGVTGSIDSSGNPGSNGC
jgi:hypothetical protein